MSEAAENGLLLRVIADTERRAADGCFREAVVLLRWAARIATRERLPLVLLSYHRILEIERARGAQERVELSSQPVRLPQFPGVAPAVERNAFVTKEIKPALQSAILLRYSPARGSGPNRRRAGFAVAGICAVLMLTSQQEVRIQIPLATSVPPAASEGALHHMDTHSTDARPEILLRLARSRLAGGDTAEAVTHLQRVREDPRASVVEVTAAVQQLNELLASSRQ